ncbi:MAG: methyltransferase domain-containing protein [Bryobacterales bacterium]|nr:methyltransferase domain-containing protein [Acidobacteriota bacterium]MCB9382991.1 methyltransferase domain-containing protein [Bryobacterales bacterium]
MRAEWDARARENAYHYVASGNETWTKEAFLQSGRESVQTFVGDDLERLCGGRDPKQMRALEIGCGAGRMTAALADVFGEVHGLDVSPVMLERAAELTAGRQNVRLHLGDGATLPPMDGAAFDFILSYIVFQHIPEKRIVTSYIRQAAERLRPGGVFKFQAQGAEPEPGEELGTWLGAHLGAADAVRLARETGCEILDFDGLGEQYFWLWFRKPETAPLHDRSGDLLMADLERRGDKTQQLETELRERTAWAQALDRRVADLDSAVPHLQGELEAANAWARSLDAEASELRAAVDERTAWAQERDRHAAELTRELDERTRWAKSLERERDERTAWARSLDAELEQARARLAALDSSWLVRIGRKLGLIKT